MTVWLRRPTVADDIVTRLRHVAWLAEEGSQVTDLAATAADEIERLRAAGDALVTVMQAGSDAGWDAAIDAWQEADRG
jgi:hypothetical protein